MNYQEMKNCTRMSTMVGVHLFGFLLFWLLYGPAMVLQFIMYKIHFLIGMIEIKIFGRKDRLIWHREGSFEGFVPYCRVTFAWWFYDQFVSPFHKDKWGLVYSDRLCMLTMILFYLTIGYFIWS